MNSRTTYITDFGKPLPAFGEDGQLAFTVDRYGVWVWDAVKFRHQVTKTGSDLDALQKEFGPCEVVILPLPFSPGEVE